MNTIAAIKSACDSLGYDAPRSYSGRGMYGKQCLGITVDRYTSAPEVAFRLAVELQAAGEQDAIEDLLDAGTWCTDSMGLGTIVYVPGLAWEEPEEADEEEEDADAAE